MKRIHGARAAEVGMTCHLRQFLGVFLRLQLNDRALAHSAPRIRVSPQSDSVSFGGGV